MVPWVSKGAPAVTASDLQCKAAGTPAAFSQHAHMHAQALLISLKCSAAPMISLHHGLVNGCQAKLPSTHESGGIRDQQKGDPPKTVATYGMPAQTAGLLRLPRLYSGVHALAAQTQQSF
jgi:hypothetical protein